MEKDPFSLPPQGPRIEQSHTQVMDHTGHIYDIYLDLKPPVGYEEKVDATEASAANQVIEDAYSPEVELVGAARDSGELNIPELVDSSRIAYHGLRYSIARVREDRAKSREDRARARVKKMNWKDEIYNDLSSASHARHDLPTKAEYSLLTPAEKVAHNEARESILVPESLVERHMDRRQSKREMKARAKAANARIVSKGYTSSANQEGLTKSQKRSERIGIATSSMSAREKHIAKLELKSRRTTNPNITQKRTEERARKSEEKHDRTVRQPIASRWRALRRSASLHSASRHDNSAQRHSARAQRHLQTAIDIENNRP